MIEIKGKYNTASIYTDSIEDEAYKQVLNLMNQKFAEGSTFAIMPDCHAGAGCVIGLTMKIVDKVVPNLVGVDIGCGMLVVKVDKSFNFDLPKVDRIWHEEIPHEPYIFNPTKSMLDILSEQIDSDLNKRLTEFGETNGFPVVFVFYQTTKNENGVSKATCDIKMYKFEDKTDARLFALQTGGEFGIFDPRSKDEQIKDLEKKVKRLEEDRDYWKRKAEGDDDDTLGIFRHWDD